jgi:hypothetical protein
MWDPKHLTTLQAFTACYGDSFNFSFAVKATFYEYQTKWCLRVTVNDSLLHLSDTFDRHIDTISKMNYRLFCHVADILNARYESCFLSPLLAEFLFDFVTLKILK